MRACAVLVRRPARLVSAVNAMRCDATLSASCGCNDRLRNAGGPALAYDEHAPGMVLSLDHEVRLLLSLQSQGIRSNARQQWLLRRHGMPWGPALNDRRRSPGSAQAVLEGRLHRATLEDTHAIWIARLPVGASCATAWASADASRGRRTRSQVEWEIPKARCYRHDLTWHLERPVGRCCIGRMQAWGIIM